MVGKWDVTRGRNPLVGKWDVTRGRDPLVGKWDVTRGRNPLVGIWDVVHPAKALGVYAGDLNVNGVWNGRRLEC